MNELVQPAPDELRAGVPSAEEQLARDGIISQVPTAGEGVPTPAGEVDGVPSGADQIAQDGIISRVPGGGEAAPTPSGSPQRERVVGGYTDLDQIGTLERQMQTAFATGDKERGKALSRRIELIAASQQAEEGGSTTEPAAPSGLDETPRVDRAAELHDRALKLRTQGDDTAAGVLSEQSAQAAKRVVDNDPNQA